MSRVGKHGTWYGGVDTTSLPYLDSRGAGATRFLQRGRDEEQLDFFHRGTWIHREIWKNDCEKRSGGVGLS